MLEARVVEKVRLRLRGEERETAVYALIVDKTGPKLVKTADADAIPNVTVMPFGLDARNRSLEDLAGILMQWTDRPVVNATRLTGSYDFKLKWAPDATQPSV